jgi:DNA-binding NarL/FixJ family response regulator
MSEDHKIRVLLVDDNDILRSGLVIFLDTIDDMELVGQGTTGQEAVELCGQVHPDVVLMDLKMPIMDGVMATEIIAQKYPSIRVIALTSFDDEALMQSAKQAGVHNYLLKNVTIDHMANAIREAYAGSKTAS